MPAFSALPARLTAMRLRRRMLLAGLSGAVAALGMQPVGAWPATMLGLAAVFGIWSSAIRTRDAALIGWAAGTGYFMVALSWIVEPFLVDIARHGWIAPIGLLATAGGMAIFWSAGFGAAHRWGGRGHLAPLVGALTLAEAARGTVLTGFPWAQPGHVLIDTPMLHWAGYGGSLGLTLMVLIAAAALWQLAARGIGAMTPAGYLIPVLFAAGMALHAPQPIPQDAPTVRLIQPNAPQRDKWHPEKRWVFFDRMLEFTEAGTKPDLVVWPETSAPVLLNDSDPQRQQIARAARGAPVVMGFQRREEFRYFNSLVVLNSAGDVVEIYDKHHLVPFGEYVPLGGLLGRFGIHGLAAQDGHGFSAGAGAQLVHTGLAGRALALICYEGVFPGDVAAAPERPDYLLLITNDAWFGQISGPYQHLAQARLRSAEQGLPMVRVANTGVSAMIDARGFVTQSIALGQAGWLDAPLPPPGAPTIYARLGDWPLLALAVMLLLQGVIRARRPSGPIDCD